MINAASRGVVRMVPLCDQCFSTSFSVFFFITFFSFFCVRLLRVKCQAFHILATDEFHFQVNRVRFFCYEFETSNYATTRINAMQLELEID